MDNKLFADSLFVSYINGTPAQERIPYVQGEALTPQIITRLTEQMLSGSVRFIQLEDETQENSLVADLRDGWSTVYIVKETENYFEFVNDEFPTCETPLNITGNGPTPKKHATEDMQLMTKIVSCFAQTGAVFPGCSWEHTVH